MSSPSQNYTGFSTCNLSFSALLPLIGSCQQRGRGEPARWNSTNLKRISIHKIDRHVLSFVSIKTTCFIFVFVSLFKRISYSVQFSNKATNYETPFLAACCRICISTNFKLNDITCLSTNPIHYRKIVCVFLMCKPLKIISYNNLEKHTCVIFYSWLNLS